MIDKKKLTFVYNRNISVKVEPKFFLVREFSEE